MLQAALSHPCPKGSPSPGLYFNTLKQTGHVFQFNPKHQALSGQNWARRREEKFAQGWAKETRARRGSRLIFFPQKSRGE